MIYIVPTHNHPELLKTLVSTYKQHHDISLDKFIIVDDFSDLGVVEENKKFCKENGFIYIENRDNLGFAKSVNVGLKYILDNFPEEEYAIELNTDLEFVKPVRDEFIKTFKMDPKIGHIGGLLFYKNGLIQDAGTGVIPNKTEPGKWCFFHEGGHKTIEQYQQATLANYKIGVTGAIWGFNLSIMKQGDFLPEQYFISHDDVEFQIRSWSKGWRTFYNPNIQCIHNCGGTRGETLEQKRAKNPYALIREQQAMNLFGCDIQKYNIQSIIIEIDKLNKDLHENGKIND